MHHHVALVLYDRNEVEKFVLEYFWAYSLFGRIFVPSEPRGVATSFMHHYVTLA